VALKRFFKDYSLTLVLISLFLGSWILQFLFQMSLATNEAIQHGQAFEWGEFWVEFFKDTFENWQSEFLQVAAFVVLSTYFIHKNSPQSRDGDDEMDAKLNEILRRLDEHS
jgi:low affinity Fe/Cu permease